MRKKRPLKEKRESRVYGVRKRACVWGGGKKYNAAKKSQEPPTIGMGGQKRNPRARSKADDEGRKITMM